MHEVVRHLLRARLHLARVGVVARQAEHVAALERAADQPDPVDAGGAQERLGLDPAREREVAAHALAGRAAAPRAGRLRTSVVIWPTGSPSTCSCKAAAGGADDHVAQREERRAAERGLDQGRSGRVADQRVGQARGAGVERPGLRHPVVGLVEPAAVEEQVERARAPRRAGRDGAAPRAAAGAASAARAARRRAARSAPGRRARTRTGRRGAGRRRSPAPCRSRSSRRASAPGRSSPARWRSRPRARGRRFAGSGRRGHAQALVGDGHHRLPDGRRARRPGTRPRRAASRSARDRARSPRRRRRCRGRRSARAR